MEKKQKTAARSKMKGMVVIVSGDRPMVEVTKDLKKAGFEVDQVLHAIGQVTGHAESGAKKRLLSIQGVAEVSDVHADFDIGAPDAPVQ